MSLVGERERERESHGGSADVVDLQVHIRHLQTGEIPFFNSRDKARPHLSNTSGLQRQATEACGHEAVAT